MESVVATIALTMGVAWASGINLYAAILTLGILGSTGNITLPPGLEILTHPMVIGAAGVMYFVEFFADKIPGVDTAWDTVHTFIRIPAGAILAAQAVGDVSAPAELTAALLGGTLAAGAHATKAGGRALINTSPEPFTNWTASVAEDVAVVAGVWAAVAHPWVFLVALAVFILFMAWILPKIWRTIAAMFRAIGRFLRGERSTSASAPPPARP